MKKILGKLLEIIAGKPHQDEVGYLFIKGKYLRYDLQKHGVGGLALEWPMFALAIRLFGIENDWLNALISVVFVFIIGVFVELAQKLMPNKQFDMLDAYIMIPLAMVSAFVIMFLRVLGL